MSRNTDYEARQRAKGLVKSTVWIPKHCVVETKQMIDYCTNDRDKIPFMVRSIKTGRMAKAVD